MVPDISISRPYRGVSPEERRTQRRSRLVEAAVAVYGERGYRNATVKAVCEQAGLTERYFYESFANSEELLIACFNAVTFSMFGEVMRAAEDAGRSRKARARAGGSGCALSPTCAGWRWGASRRPCSWSILHWAIPFPFSIAPSLSRSAPG